jgi:UDP-N-acetylglucosamine 2-epimerase (hydrolysing)
MKNRKRKLVFLTGTRAEYGKMKSLIRKVERSRDFDVYLFITGMHMLPKYGLTFREILKSNHNVKLHYFKNQTNETKMDIALSNTISGFSSFINEIKPDMIIIHGDRVEALAGAIVGSLNNILVSHIEGGEVSGTIDELIRHSITKLSHIHFVANNEAKKRVLQMGEEKDSIFIIGSPDIDVMISKELPSIEEVKERYKIEYEKYSIFIYHPVVTKVKDLKNNIDLVLEELIKSNKNYIVIYPNNDEGSGIIINAYKILKKNKNFMIFPSIRFEYFLTLLKNAEFIIGNSSIGVRSASIYGVGSINIGTRQNGRSRYAGGGIINVKEDRKEILDSIYAVSNMNIKQNYYFGSGNSSERFFNILNNEKVWNIPHQKIFIDIDNY